AGDPADARARRGGGRGVGGGGSHVFRPLVVQLAARASAPETISLISWVISACLAVLARRVYLRMRSSALSVAVCIARCRAASSEAEAWSIALKMRLSM